MGRVTPPVVLQRMAEMTDEELAEVYAPLGEPWLRVNFVSTLDGATQGSDGLSKSINNAADKRVFTLLRRRADCLVVGAGTLRTEGYVVPRLPLVVVTRSGDVPPTLREAPEGRVRLATVTSAPGLAAARDLLGAEHVWELGDREVDQVALKQHCADHGWRDILSEGGPQLFGSMLAAGVVDELCHTVVPRIIGGDHLRLVAGAEVDVAMSPHTLLEQDGTLLARWLVS